MFHFSKCFQSNFKRQTILKKPQTSYWICELGVRAQLTNSKFGKISSCSVKLPECQIVRNGICIYPQFYASSYEHAAFKWTGHPAWCKPTAIAAFRQLRSMIWWLTPMIRTSKSQCPHSNLQQTLSLPGTGNHSKIILKKLRPCTISFSARIYRKGTL